MGRFIIRWDCLFNGGGAFCGGSRGQLVSATVFGTRYICEGNVFKRTGQLLYLLVQRNQALISDLVTISQLIDQQLAVRSQKHPTGSQRRSPLQGLDDSTVFRHVIGGYTQMQRARLQLPAVRPIDDPTGAGRPGIAAGGTVGMNNYLIDIS